MATAKPRAPRRLLAAALVALAMPVAVVATSAPAEANNSCTGTAMIVTSPSTIYWRISSPIACNPFQVRVRYMHIGQTTYTYRSTKSYVLPAGGEKNDNVTNLAPFKLAGYQACSVPPGIPIACNMGVFQSNSTPTRYF
jgi:hypothetical protein